MTPYAMTCYGKRRLQRDQALGSSSTLCRWENRTGRTEAWLMHQMLFEQFVTSFEAAPEELILDFDATF